MLLILQPPFDHLVSAVQAASRRLCMHPPCIQMVQLGGNQDVSHEIELGMLKLRGFIKGQALCKLTSCEDDFAHLV